MIAALAYRTGIAPRGLAPDLSPAQMDAVLNEMTRLFQDELEEADQEQRRREMEERRAAAQASARPV